MRWNGVWPADPDQLTFDSPRFHGYDGPTVEWWLEVKV